MCDNNREDQMRFITNVGYVSVSVPFSTTQSAPAINISLRTLIRSGPIDSPGLITNQKDYNGLC